MGYIYMIKAMADFLVYNTLAFVSHVIELLLIVLIQFPER